MWFGGTGILTLLTLGAILLTGGAIIPIIIIGAFVWFVMSILSDLFNHKL